MDAGESFLALDLENQYASLSLKDPGISFEDAVHILCPLLLRCATGKIREAVCAFSLAYCNGFLDATVKALSQYNFTSTIVDGQRKNSADWWLHRVLQDAMKDGKIWQFVVGTTDRLEPFSSLFDQIVTSGKELCIVGDYPRECRRQSRYVTYVGLSTQPHTPSSGRSAVRVKPPYRTLVQRVMRIDGERPSDDVDNRFAYMVLVQNEVAAILSDTMYLYPVTPQELLCCVMSRRAIRDAKISEYDVERCLHALLWESDMLQVTLFSFTRSRFRQALA